MKYWLFAPLAFVVTATIANGADAPHKLANVEKLPEGLAAPIASALNPKGYSVTGTDGAVCEVWFVKEVPLKPGFSPSLSVKYPLTPGTLIGAIRVTGKGPFTDFRDTQMKPGVYTLRYGQQPADGNHLGTSDVADFLLAIPASADSDPKPIGVADQLNKSSAKASGTTHPAIFLLLSAEEKKADKPELLHDDDHDYWILSVSIEGKEGEKKIPLPIRLVTVGKSEA